MSKSIADLGEIADEYWLALGQFIHAFSSVEASVQILLWVVADTDPQTAKAIFSGAKTDVACSFMRRIFEARGQELPELLARAFTQLSFINEARNSIVHYGAKFDGTDWYASNDLMALPGKARRHDASAPTLQAMRADLNTISTCMSSYFLDNLPENQKAAPGAAVSLRTAALAPWRYIPPQQQPARKTILPKTPKHRPRRGASPG